VISQDGDNRNRSRAQRLGYLARLVRISPVGQVATQREDIGVVGHLADENL
jgi:hypothetical protein